MEFGQDFEKIFFKLSLAKPKYLQSIKAGFYTSEEIDILSRISNQFYTAHCFVYVHRLCAKPTDLKWLRNKVLFGSFPDGIKMVGLTRMSLLWKSQKWTAGRPEKDKGQILFSRIIYNLSQF